MLPSKTANAFYEPGRWKLRQVAMFLVAVPFVFQVVFIVTLDLMLSKSEDETKQSQRQKQIVSEATDVARLTYQGCNAMAGYFARHDPGSVVDFGRARQAIAAKLRDLKAIVDQAKVHGDASADEEGQIVLEVGHSAARAFKKLAMIKESVDEGNQMIAAAIASGLQGENSDLTKLAVAMENLTTVASRSITPEEAAWKQRTTRRTAELIGLSASLLLAGGLALLFNRSTQSRLNVLMDNTMRLSRKEQLHPPVEGRDEIAELDKVFHDTAEALAAADKFKQEFYSMVSHDLRTPLTAIQGTLTLISRGDYGELSQSGQERILGAENSAQRLIKLINELLDMEKLNAGKLNLQRQYAALPTLVERSVESVRGFAEQNSVALQVAAEEIDVYADVDRLVQVLVNLLSNAIKFSPGNSIVRVEARLVETFVEVRVIDRGRGIPEDQRMAIFERFRQIEKADGGTKGTGLGLAICKAIIEQHGGTIGVESTLGEGSVFWLRVPQPADDDTDDSDER